VSRLSRPRLPPTLRPCSQQLGSQIQGAQSGLVSFPERISMRLVARLVGPCELSCRLVGITIEDDRPPSPQATWQRARWTNRGPKQLVQSCPRASGRIPCHFLSGQSQNVNGRDGTLVAAQDRRAASRRAVVLLVKSTTPHAPRLPELSVEPHVSPSVRCRA
jgi:hypothetical protein